jgi:hypothetical protein
MGLSLRQTDCLMKHLDSLTHHSANKSRTSSHVPQGSLKEEDIISRSEGLSTVFSSQQELNFYRFCREANLSQFMEERLFKMVTSVSSSLSFISVYMLCRFRTCIVICQTKNRMCTAHVQLLLCRTPGKEKKALDINL